MRFGEVSPTEDLTRLSDPDDLAGPDRSGDDNLPTEGIRGPHEDADRPTQADLCMGPSVVPEPDDLLGSEAEVDDEDRPLPSTLQLTEPLVRHQEIRQDRHAEDAVGVPEAEETALIPERRIDPDAFSEAK